MEELFVILSIGDAKIFFGGTKINEWILIDGVRIKITIHE